METARLVFGRAQAMNEVRGGPAQPEDPRRYDELRKLLSTPVAKGENRVISSHGNPFHAVAGPPTSPKARLPWCAPTWDPTARCVSP